MVPGWVDYWGKWMCIADSCCRAGRGGGLDGGYYEGER